MASNSNPPPSFARSRRRDDISSQTQSDCNTLRCEALDVEKTPGDIGVRSSRDLAAVEGGVGDDKERKERKGLSLLQEVRKQTARLRPF